MCVMLAIITQLEKECPSLKAIMEHFVTFPKGEIQKEKPHIERTVKNAKLSDKHPKPSKEISQLKGRPLSDKGVSVTKTLIDKAEQLKLGGNEKVKNVLARLPGVEISKIPKFKTAVTQLEHIINKLQNLELAAKSPKEKKELDEKWNLLFTMLQIGDGDCGDPFIQAINQAYALEFNSGIISKMPLADQVCIKLRDGRDEIFAKAFTHAFEIEVKREKEKRNEFTNGIKDLILKRGRGGLDDASKDAKRLEELSESYFNAPS